VNVIITGQSARTYLIDPCPRLDWNDRPDSEPCRIAELDHYDRPTGELFCYTHSAMVGTLEPPS
jgi:hypothetical protein